MFENGIEKKFAKALKSIADEYRSISESSSENVRDSVKLTEDFFNYIDRMRVQGIEEIPLGAVAEIVQDFSNAANTLSLDVLNFHKVFLDLFKDTEDFREEAGLAIHFLELYQYMHKERPVGDKRKKKKRGVYFIASGQRIKIGYSSDVRSRVNALSTMMPNKPTVLGYIPGKQSLESKLHKQFDHLRIHGEWFTDDGDIRTFLEVKKSFKKWEE